MERNPVPMTADEQIEQHEAHAGADEVGDAGMIIKKGGSSGSAASCKCCGSYRSGCTDRCRTGPDGSNRAETGRRAVDGIPARGGSAVRGFAAIDSMKSLARRLQALEGGQDSTYDHWSDADIIDRLNEITLQLRPFGLDLPLLDGCPEDAERLRLSETLTSKAFAEIDAKYLAMHGRGRLRAMIAIHKAGPNGTNDTIGTAPLHLNGLTSAAVIKPASSIIAFHTGSRAYYVIAKPKYGVRLTA